MQSKSLIRWGGMALLVGGVLYTINSFFYTNNYSPKAPFNPLWLSLQIIITIFYALSTLGLIGLHLRQKDKAGKLGLIGIILAIFGSAITFVTSLGFAFVIPAVAAQQANPLSPIDLSSPTGPLAWIGVLMWAWLLAFIPGYILTGIVTIRTRILPRWAGIFVSVGMILIFVAAFAVSVSQSFWLRNIGGMLSGVGLAWLGYALWSNR